MAIKILIFLSFFTIAISAEFLENNQNKNSINRDLIEFCLTCNGWECDARLCSDGNYTIFNHIPQEIREDKVFSIQMIKKAPHYLKHISSTFKDDKKIVSLAIRKSGRTLMYASQRLQEDRKLVHLALQNDGYYLCHLKKKFYNDKELILKAVSTTKGAFSCVPKHFQKDKDLQNLRRQYLSKNSQEIKRKVKTNAWNQYTLKETLVALYGEKIRFIETDEINISLPKFASNISRIPLSINSSIKAKSAAVVKDEENEKSLLGFFLMNNAPLDNYRFQFSFNKDGATSNVFVIIEGTDGNFYISKPSLVKTSICTGGYNPPTIKENKAKLHKAIKDINYIRKVRYKQDGNKIRMMIALSYPRVTYAIAKLWDEKVNFISHVVVRMDNKIVYDFYPSQVLSSEVTLKFNAYLDSDFVKDIEVILTNIHGEVITHKVK